MRKFKKALAFALASAMIVSAVPASAAAKTNSAKGTKTTIYTYTVDKSKQGNGNNKKSWIKVTTKKGYTYKLVNKTKDIVSSISKTGFEAKKPGTAKINVNFYKNGKYVETKSVKITVKKAPMIGAVSLSKDTVNVGETATVSNAGKGTAYFYSSNKDVATVDKKSGEIKALAGGTTTITAVNTITKARVKLTLTVVADAPVAKQSGASTITVTNGVEMSTTDLKVVKGSTSIATDKVELSADKKTITITTSSNLTDGTYTVTFADKKLDVTAQSEKVENIKILSDKAAVVPATKGGTDYTTATVGYKVENQFGEDITNSTTLQASGTGVNNSSVSDGKVVFNAGASQTFIPNRDVVSLVLVHLETGKTAQATLTVSDAATVSELTFEGVYNAENKTLNEDADPSEFYLLFTAKDQYGSSMIDDITIDKDLYVTLAGGITNLGATKTTKVITKNGQKYLGIKLGYADASKEQLTLGTASLTAIAAGSGKSATANVEVAVGSTIDTFSIASPGTVAQGEDVTLEYTALDRNGNAITSYDQLKRIQLPSTSSSSDYTLELRKTSGGKGEFVFNYGGTVTADSSRTVVLTFTTPTYKVSTVQLTIKAGAKPAKISGAKAGTVVATTRTDKLVKAQDLKFIDSYGREIAASALDTAFDANYQIVVDASKTKDVVIADANGSTVTGTAIVAGTDVKDGANVFKVKRGAKAESTVVVELQKFADRKWNTISTAEIPVKVADITNVSSVTATVGTVYVPATASGNAIEFAQSFTVKGKNAGDEFTLAESSDYKLESLSSNIAVDRNKVYAAKNRKDIAALNSADTTTGKVRVILASGETYDIDVTLSKVAPTTKAITLNESSYTVTSGASISVDANNNISITGVDGKAGAVAVVKEIKDSNDVTHAAAALNNTTVANLFKASVTTDDKDKVTYDFDSGYTLSNVKSGDQITFTIAYGNSVTKVVRLTVK